MNYSIANYANFTNYYKATMVLNSFQGFVV